MSRHFLENIYTLGVDFPSRADELSSQFEVMLAVSGTPYNVSTRANLIDQYVVSTCINGNIFPSKLFNNTFFQPMIAFLGEAIVQQLPGRWEAVLVESDPHDVYEMVITQQNEDALSYIDLTTIAHYMYDQSEVDEFGISSIVDYLLTYPEKWNLDDWDR